MRLQSVVSKSPIVFLCVVALQIADCSDFADRARSYYQDGMKLLARHDPQKAGIQFKNAIRLKGDMLPAWRGLAQAEEDSRHLSNLLPVLQTIVKLDPQDVTTRLRLARLLLLSNAADQAAALVDNMGHAQDKNADVHAAKALIFYRLRNKDRAVHEAQSALDIDPGNVDALEVLATDRLDKGDPKGALSLLDKAPLKQSNSLGIRLLQIRIYEKIGDFQQLEATLRSLSEMYPEQAGFRNRLVKLYVDQHRYADAESMLRAAAAAPSNRSEAGLNLVRFLYAVKGPEAARHELVSRINAGGDAFPYQLALADLDFAQGDFADSSKLLQSIAANSVPAHAVAAKLKLAEMNVEKKRFDVAEHLITALLNDNSFEGLKARVGALNLRASIAMERGHPEAAIPDLREALGRQSRSPVLMLRLATAYERNGEIDLADRQYAAALSSSNFNPDVGLTYVTFLQRRNNTDRAEEVLTELASRYPDNLAVLSALADIKVAQSDWAGAQRISEAIRRLDNGGAVADRILGVTLGGEKKYDESIAALQNAVSEAPSAAQPMTSLVRAFVLSKQTDRAISFLRTFLKSHPDNALAYVLLGSVALAANAPEQAVNNFQMAIEKQPDSSIGYRALANSYLRANKVQAAVTTLRAGLKRQPQNLSLHIALGGALERAEDYEGAISEYESAITQEPGSMVAANNLASLLADRRTDKVSLDRAYSLAASLRQSQVPQFKDTLGWISYRRGDYKAGTQLLERAATAMPDLALVHYHLGMSYAAMGQNAKAVLEFKAALSKERDDGLKETIKAELTRTSSE